MVNLSPTKQSFLLAEAQMLLILNKKSEASLVLKKSYELDKTNIEALKYYVYSLIGDNKIGDVDKILDDHAKDINVIKVDPTFDKITVWADPIIMQAMVDVKAFDKALSIAKKMVHDNPKDVKAEVSLSAVYLKSGDKWSAIEELKKVKILQPSYAADVDKYIKDIQEGRDPSAGSDQGTAN